MPTIYVEDIIVEAAFLDASMGEYIRPMFDGRWADLYDLAWMIQDEYMERVAE